MTSYARYRRVSQAEDALRKVLYNKSASVDDLRIAALRLEAAATNAGHEPRLYRSILNEARERVVEPKRRAAMTEPTELTEQEEAQVERIGKALDDIEQRLSSRGLNTASEIAVFGIPCKRSYEFPNTVSWEGRSETDVRRVFLQLSNGNAGWTIDLTVMALTTDGVGTGQTRLVGTGVDLGAAMDSLKANAVVVAGFLGGA